MRGKQKIVQGCEPFSINLGIFVCSFHVCWASLLLYERVEKIDPCSMDCPLTPTPRSTLRTTSRTRAYQLHLQDHNCMKNSHHLLFTDFLDGVFFLFLPHSSSATCLNPVFLNGLLNTFFLPLTLTLAKKQLC